MAKEDKTIGPMISNKERKHTQRERYRREVRSWKTAKQKQKRMAKG